MLRKLISVKYVKCVKPIHKLQHQYGSSQLTFVKVYNIASLDVDV
jgi:hypothetical protein